MIAGAWATLIALIVFTCSAGSRSAFSGWVRGAEAFLAADEGHIIVHVRDGDRVFLTYSTTARGNEPADGSLGLLDMTPYGRGEAWQDDPDGWPQGRPSCWYWRSDADGTPPWDETSRPVPQWTRPGATPVETLGRHDHGR